MIRTLPWHKMPSLSTLQALPKIQWSSDDGLAPASSTVALMVYVILHFSADEVIEHGVWDMPLKKLVATASYDQLMSATGGRSRSLISDALPRLERLGLITREGSNQKRRYVLKVEARWFKLPCQAIVQHGVVVPFKNFTLRSRHELNALKLYLYLAARRDNVKVFSLASYENISSNTGVPERYIPKALNILAVTNLLHDVKQERDASRDQGYGPNHYYLTGHKQLTFAALVQQTSTAPAA
jgi:hypothetical protein